MADSEKVSSLPSERERFEAFDSAYFAHLDSKPSYTTLDTINGGWVYGHPNVQHRFRYWCAASAGRQELLDALKKARNQLDPDCFTDENAAACLERIYALLAKHGG